MLVLHILIIIALAVGAAYSGACMMLVLWFSKLGGGRDKSWPIVLIFCAFLAALIYVTYNPGWLGHLWSMLPTPPNPAEVLR